MMRFVLPLLCLLVSLTAARDTSTSLEIVKATFEKAKIPANASLTFNPSVLLEVALPQVSGPPVQLRAGNNIPVNATALPPKFGIIPAGTDAVEGPFVVAAIDLDAPTPQDPIYAEIRHFLGGDFQLVGATLSNSTPAISNWLQPGPPAGSDPHRYVFWLFQQPTGFDKQTFVTASTPITNFNLSQFASAVGLGDPIGGTFMLVGPAPAV